ncbi:MAG: hypothetical protein JSR48_13590 [Verrucomicrobia bacterium]|nr:hypothetical protein [Verrucomicrobiota bacterium]
MSPTPFPVELVFMPSSNQAPQPAKPRTAASASNANHHLWQHGKNWWVYCAVNPTPCTKDKLRRSLCTESVIVARFRRDELFRRLHELGMLGRIRAMSRRADVRGFQEAAPGQTWQQRADAALAIVMSLPVPRRKKISGVRGRRRRRQHARLLRIVVAAGPDEEPGPAANPRVQPFPFPSTPTLPWPSRPPVDLASGNQPNPPPKIPIIT